MRAASLRQGSALLGQLADPADGPELSVDLADFRAALHDEFRKFTEHLSPVERDIIRLSFFEGKKPQEIKVLLGVTTTKAEEFPRLWNRHLVDRYPHTLDFLQPESQNS